MVLFHAEISFWLVIVQRLVCHFTIVSFSTLVFFCVCEINLTGELRVDGKAEDGQILKTGLQLWLYEWSMDKIITVIYFHKHCSTERETQWGVCMLRAHNYYNNNHLTRKNIMKSKQGILNMQTFILAKWKAKTLFMLTIF